MRKGGSVNGWVSERRQIEKAADCAIAILDRLILRFAQYSAGFRRNFRSLLHWVKLTLVRKDRKKGKNGEIRVDSGGVAPSANSYITIKLSLWDCTLASAVVL